MRMASGNLLSSPAIEVRNGYKHYGRGRGRVPVLINMEMRIPRGAIYGLLGPSGCGKTTLLQCIVGKQRLQAGSVTVFGHAPGSKRAGVPGKRVGYMPQELALYTEFSIRETLHYFGRIFGLTSAKIDSRSDFLVEFLDLPTQKNRLIAALSGGQKRRVSLAAALLHEPELLILDEPTVGVDPLLRQCIWTHLLEISEASHLKTTIVITTHYIEEARQANVVGMMRFGRLLAEDSPRRLMRTFHQSNLEDVFLQLCIDDKADGDGQDKRVQDVPRNSLPSSPINNNDTFNYEENRGENENNTFKTSESNGNDLDKNGESVELGEMNTNKVEMAGAEEIDVKRGANDGENLITSFVSPHRLMAMLAKNFIRMWRNIGFLLFQFVIPTLQVALFCLAIGREPRHLGMAVVNEEMLNNSACQGFPKGCVLDILNDAHAVNAFDNDKNESSDEFDLDFDFGSDFGDSINSNLSCRLLSYINSEVIELTFESDLEQALDKARRAETWGVLHFKPNFSKALFNRMEGILSNDLSKDDLDQGEVHVYTDMTNQQVGYSLQLELAASYQRFTEGLMSSCGRPVEVASLPIRFEKPIYGSQEPTFTEFMAPGVILSITYFMAVGLTALSFILERKEGLLDRSFVAGVTATELMLAHVIAQFVVMAVQVTLVLLFMIQVFAVPAKGPLVWIVGLTLLQGLCGMAFGLVISALCDNEQDAIQVALGSFYPNLLLSGIIWPLEGMPKELKYISYVLPQTYACEAMRGLLSRGWNILWMQVYRGYYVTLLWTMAMLVLSAVILRIRQ